MKQSVLTASKLFEATKTLADISDKVILCKINIEDLPQIGNHIFIVTRAEYDRYYGNDIDVYLLTKGQLIEMLKSSFSYVQEEETEDEFLNNVPDANGDGADYYQVFTIQIKM